ncbi:nucleoside recognition domain-containing protein [Caldibacillus lycopersici]|uniref:Nucleoside recognition domain-containing protein n=1 Tax=Perspicuibacillus lycopersici TaxID=1325689 RepID=A0AAE3LSN3_9BACI|nr:nucleoside recognition domain-containing protein [Perspicuibacillus lycopersici]MCU9612928.1 nucleoside recognition domain-containing protein [Perspicuibacillus lycopersici]
MFMNSLKNGALSGLKTTWTLGKVIFPVTLIVALLQHSPVLPWIIDKIAPLMNVFGLSGDAAIPLVLGNLLNLYAGIGAILTLDLSVKEVFIIAIMLSFSHNLLIESSVAMKSGVKLWVILTVRIGLAMIAALLVNLCWNGGAELAQYGLISTSNTTPTGVVAIFMDGLQRALLGVVQLAIIVIPLMIGIQFLKDLKWLDFITKWMHPITRMLGMKENTALTMTVGLVLGLAYGAGVLIQAVKEEGVTRKDATLAFIFLIACHAVVEDTLIFVPLGIPVLPLLLIRLCTAIILTFVIARVWNRSESIRRKEVSLEGKY